MAVEAVLMRPSVSLLRADVLIGPLQLCLPPPLQRSGVLRVVRSGVAMSKVVYVAPPTQPGLSGSDGL